jgi:CDP-diacylglycerol--glycerol-3-phosphate 3-phosphatidyltransferase
LTGIPWFKFTHFSADVAEKHYLWDLEKPEFPAVKHLPNVISALRIAGSISLLFCDVAGWPFWVLYALCGISDMVDGWLARKLHAETKAGSILDSVADLSFVVCCAIRLLPLLSIPSWLWIWAGIIVVIKIVNQVSAWVVFKRFCFPHTVVNKLTGFLLFLAVPTFFWTMIPVAVVAAVATFAAIQEGHLIRTKQVV